MDIETVGLLGLLFLIVAIILVEVLVMAIVAGYVASLLGVSGILWWCIAIVIFLLINGILGALTRIGN